jgi:hypothetical protein
MHRFSGLVLQGNFRGFFCCTTSRGNYGMQPHSTCVRTFSPRPARTFRNAVESFHCGEITNGNTTGGDYDGAENLPREHRAPNVCMREYDKNKKARRVPG